MDRWASGIDTAWLQLERPTNRMVVHGILFCSGPVDEDLLRERIRERWVATYPGLRQRPTWPFPLGPARWVDAPPDLDRHVRSVPLEAPGDDATLARHVGAVMSRPLPVDRPWWSVHLMSGYTGAKGANDTGAAMLVSIHHGLADGVALDHLFHALADEPAAEGTPAAFAAPPRRSRPVHDVRLLRREVADRARSLAATVRSSATPEGARELRDVGRAVSRSAALLARPPAEAASGLQGELGTEKAARWSTDVPVATVRDAGKRLGGTVNDVLCAAIAGALRTTLGEDTPRLRAVMPTNLRPLDRPISDELGNEFGLVLPPLPTDDPDPDRRVERMHAWMSTIKRTNQALATFAGIAGAGHGRAAWTQALVRRYAEAASVIISNVPGPRAPLTLAGTPVRDALFWVPCSGQLGLGVSILSYAGRLRLGVAADLAVMGGEEGVDRFVAALDAQLERL